MKKALLEIVRLTEDIITTSETLAENPGEGNGTGENGSWGTPVNIDG